MIDDACEERTNVPLVKVGPENGRSAVIRNTNRLEHRRVQVDGCVKWDGPIADWVIERGDEAVIIELKGRNVEHGADQIYATAHQWKVIEKRCDRVAGLIVGRQTPAASTSIQLKKQRFARAFGGPLHVVNANAEYDLNHLMSFKGPFRS